MEVFGDGWVGKTLPSSFPSIVFVIIYAMKLILPAPPIPNISAASLCPLCLSANKYLGLSENKKEEEGKGESGVGSNRYGGYGQVCVFLRHNSSQHLPYPSFPTVAPLPYPFSEMSPSISRSVILGVYYFVAVFSKKSTAIDAFHK
ncbi:hypothetical protein ERO13_D02G172166v2 [Gossypium hirsutum]|uniref:Uncharacterized protein n=1 Tax=Gossypium hirsutum TaxID=3635 RepID=A0A1U8JWG4_GOSHI|nr:uncharacterized protein LOC107909549 [Gossypium hirsutum]KAG4159377.1 hypothetical protein ERO13_D02G172166v2 [Gossypium hirsutum]